MSPARPPSQQQKRPGSGPSAGTRWWDRTERVEGQMHTSSSSQHVRLPSKSKLQLPEPCWTQTSPPQVEVVKLCGLWAAHTFLNQGTGSCCQSVVTADIHLVALSGFVPVETLTHVWGGSEVPRPLAETWLCMGRQSVNGSACFFWIVFWGRFPPEEAEEQPWECGGLSRAAVACCWVTWG